MPLSPPFGATSAAQHQRATSGVPIEFSYGATFAIDLAKAALEAVLVGLIACFSIAAFSWMTRGFTRG
jgi:hypothetical protein